MYVVRALLGRELYPYAGPKISVRSFVPPPSILHLFSILSGWCPFVCPFVPPPTVVCLSVRPPNRCLFVRPSPLSYPHSPAQKPRYVRSPKTGVRLSVRPPSCIHTLWPKNWVILEAQKPVFGCTSFPPLISTLSGPKTGL